MVIVPIVKEKDQYSLIDEKMTPVILKMRARGISVHYDNRETHKPGWKFAEYELKGVPLRLAVGPRDLENNTVELARRDTMEKSTYSIENIDGVIENLLEEIQRSIYSKALKYREEHTTEVNSYEEFKMVLDEKGGYIKAHWDGTTETEESIKNETKATIRCILLEEPEEAGKCIYSGKPSSKKVVFAKAY